MIRAGMMPEETIQPRMIQAMRDETCVNLPGAIGARPVPPAIGEFGREFRVIALRTCVPGRSGA